MNSAFKSSINNDISRKFRYLIGEGVDVESACRSLGISVVLGQELIDSMEAETSKIQENSLAITKATNFEDKINNFKSEGADILIRIARHADRPSDQLKALSLIFTGNGILPDADLNALGDRVLKMREKMLELELRRESNKNSNNHHNSISQRVIDVIPA